MIHFQQSGEEILIPVRVVPRASTTAVDSEHDGAIKIRIKAPPVDGEANRELIRFLAKLLGVPRSDVSIVRGERGRSKTISVRGVSLNEAQAKLGIE